VERNEETGKFKPGPAGRKPPSGTFTARVSAELLAQLDEAVEQEGTSRSALVSRILAAWFGKRDHDG